MATVPSQTSQDREDNLRVIALNQAVNLGIVLNNDSVTTPNLVIAAEKFYTFLAATEDPK